MRGGLGILARNNFAGRANPSRIFAGQCGAGWPALPSLIFNLVGLGLSDFSHVHYWARLGELHEKRPNVT